MAVRTKDTENLSRENLKEVIELLSAETPITKKTACEKLNIAYNTTRLDKIINDFLEKEAFRSEQRKKRRGTPLTRDDYQTIASSYMEGVAIDNIAERLYRSLSVVQSALDEMKLPRRSKKHSYQEPQLIPDDLVSDQFELGELVWSARYESLAEVVELVEINPSLGYVYRIWLRDEKWLQYAYQPAYELASLKHLINFGVTL